MAKTYGTEPTALKPTKLSKKVLADIGRLIRAFAEVEDIVSIYLAQLAGLTESKSTIILGRMQLRSRIEMAGVLATQTGKQITEIHKAAFSEAFWDALFCRNTVTHGVLMGKSQDGQRDGSVNPYFPSGVDFRCSEMWFLL